MSYTHKILLHKPWNRKIFNEKFQEIDAVKNTKKNSSQERGLPWQLPLFVDPLYLYLSPNWKFQLTNNWYDSYLSFAGWTKKKGGWISEKLNFWQVAHELWNTVYLWGTLWEIGMPTKLPKSVERPLFLRCKLEWQGYSKITRTASYFSHYVNIHETILR